MSPGQIALFIVGTIVIIFAAYYATYYLGVIGLKQPRARQGREIVLRERFAISKDKSFLLIEVNEKVYFVGVTNQSISMLDTIDAEAFAQVWGRQGAYSPGKLQRTIVNSFASFLAERMRQEKPQDNGGEGDIKDSTGKPGGKSADTTGEESGARGENEDGEFPARGDRK